MKILLNELNDLKNLLKNARHSSFFKPSTLEELEKINKVLSAAEKQVVAHINLPTCRKE